MPRIVRSLFAALAVLALVAAPAAAADPDVDLPEADVQCRGAEPGTEVAPDELPEVDGEPVLLVHGTFTNGDEHYRWGLAEALASDGFTVCWFDYPNRGLDDMQTSSETTVDAIGQVAAATGRQVDVLGHSQGAILPRWAVRFFESARDAVDDLVLLAGPQHGTTAIRGYGLSGDEHGCTYFPGCTEAMWQFDPGSDFIAALNSQQETFASIDYTSIYSEFDQLVRPPETAELAGGDNVVNIRVQDLCPGRPVEHLGLAADHVTKRLAVDAFTEEGPADPGIIDLADCAQPVYEGADPLVGVMVGLESFMQQKGFDYRPADSEPPLRDYARD